MLKQCSLCKQWKNADAFYKRMDSPDGLRGQCKQCCDTQNKKYRDNLSDEEKQIRKQRSDIARKQYYEQNKEKISEQKKKERKEFHAEILEKERQYEQQNITYRKQYKKAYNKQYYERNREAILETRKEKYISDKLRIRFSNFIYKALKDNKAEQHWEDLVPYNLQQLKEHLESQFDENMTWDNYGEYWEIDHIVPQNIFNFTSHSDHDFQICWSLMNLRPLEKHKNKSRPKDGSDVSEELKYEILNQTLIFHI